VALYPDNLLLLVASPIWALNAHFWIHLLLTPLTMFWLARRWGLGREAAWVAGVCYAASGYFLSTLNLYNLIAPAALAPALAAELLGLSTANRPARRTWVGALIWALLLTAGDPMTAVMALGLAVLAVLVRDGWRRPQWGRMMVAVAAGTLVAAPQVIEFLRILALSYRGHWGYSASAATAASWNPITALEWLIPLAFGFPDFTFWGHRFYFGDQPLFYSLYPGLLALALIAVGWRPRVPAARWSWIAIALGLFLSLGRANPVMGTLLEVTGAGIVRLPVKFWLLVAVGASILCGLGFQRATTRDGRRALSGSLGVLLLIFLVAWTWLTVTPARIEGLIADLLPANHPSEVAQFVRLRWAGVSFFSCCLAAGFLMAARLLPRQPRVLPALLLFGHLAAQLFFLAPLFETDDPGAYQAPSKVQNRVPEGSRVVHGAHLNLFGPVPVPLGEYPDPSARWFQRQSFEEFHPWVGMRRGRKFDFNLSPEGLDSFLTRATTQALERLSDTERVRLLEASGVEWLLLKRSLAPEVLAQGSVELTERFAFPGDDLRLYRVTRPAPAVQFAGNLLYSRSLNESLAHLLEPGLDTRSSVVLAGEGPAGGGKPGTVRLLSESARETVWEVEAEGDGALVIQRSHLPLYLAAVDGERVPIWAANLHRMAVRVPAGQHIVKIWVDRRPLRLGAAISLLTCALLAVLTGYGRRIRSGALDEDA
jgi:hypothetical protein